MVGTMNGVVKAKNLLSVPFMLYFVHKAPKGLNHLVSFHVLVQYELVDSFIEAIAVFVEQTNVATEVVVSLYVWKPLKIANSG